MRGETVYIVTRTQTGTDPGGDAIYSTVETPVDDVLVENGSQANSTDSIRPDGIEVLCTLLFPASYTDSLRGALIKVRDNTYKVIGDPLAYDGQMRVTKHRNRVVECMRGDG